jgi:hypothetical protein
VGCFKREFSLLSAEVAEPRLEAREPFLATFG